jgi:hypothetical protein
MRCSGGLPRFVWGGKGKGFLLYPPNFFEVFWSLFITLFSACYPWKELLC